MRTPLIEKMVQGVWNEAGTDGWTAVLPALLRTLSLPYGSIVAARNRLYDQGLLKQQKLPCPVISVGNLTVGGTGKTPMVIFIAHILKDHGYRPAVLSRGYGGSARSPINVVSDGNRILMGWREAGDEPILIARAAPGIPVLTGSRRILTGRAAVETFGADVLILDDAFQHRSLFRDIDMVLLDAARPFGNGFLLPRGPLREPPNSLRRADIIIRTGEGENGEPLREAASLPSFRAIHKPQGLVAGETNRIETVAALLGQKVFAFAGIGYPEVFRRSLMELGAAVVGFQVFPDHHPYDLSDINNLRRLAAESGAARIVTTEKDGIRLVDFPDFLAEISLLRIAMEITPAGPFSELVSSRLTDERGKDLA
ncbi:MAG: tetraacyldisaccharide 4'-kinase [Deltaproteobacteria bacterium]|nr:MAG: tetraacyldisaccharide 4'-kinase [Deltaproteobacteria bacterium]